jgi:cell division protein FtsB
MFPPGDRRLRAAVDHAADRALRQARSRVPAAEAAAQRWLDRTRPERVWLATEWRRLGTAAAVALFLGLLLHVMFGANGMVVYRQKHAELQALQKDVDRLQNENARYINEIRALKSDPAAIEKEAREQLHYTRPGEFVLVAPQQPSKPAPGNPPTDHTK